MYCRIPKNKRNNRLPPHPHTPHLNLLLLRCVTDFTFHVYSQVYDSSRQPPATAVCENNPGCSHVCLPSRQNSFTCACPSGMVVTTDGKTCVVQSATETPPTGMCYFPSSTIYRYVLLPFQAPPAGMCYSPSDISTIYRYVLLPFP